MVGTMDEGRTEGLFLRNYLGTVSAVPRPRTATHVDYGVYHTPSENGIANHGRGIYDLEDTDSRWKQEVELRNDAEEDRDRKKEKKWTLGGLFRRKSKKDEEDSSEESPEEGKKGFLGRRKSKRERRKVKSRHNGFDVVIPQQKETKNGEISVEQLWSGKSEGVKNPVRYIHRHPETGRSGLEVSKSPRRDSRSSGGSEHTEGRRGRKEVMARAEAKRDLMRDESSSDEYESYHSNSSLNRLNGEGRRPRRTDRHKRLSRDEEERVIKSDLEGNRRLPPNCRWISRTYYPDGSDYDVKHNLVNHSGTPSPCRSPRARQKQMLQYMMMQNGYPTSTFPPGVHHPSVMPPMRNHHAKENHPVVGYRNQMCRTIRNSDCNLPRSLSSSENSNRRTLMDYEQYLNSCGPAKSLSCEQNIHRASYFENEADFPRKNRPSTPRRSNRGEPPTNAGRPDIYNHQPIKTYNGVTENRTDSTPSLQSGTLPQHPTQIVHKSPAANSFCENGLQPNRSNSYHHLPAPHPHYPRPDLPTTPSILRYYADQNPRSRNPIHITCNPATSDHPYLSDSQIPARSSASDFWKQKDQQLMRQQKSEGVRPQQSKPDSSSPKSTEGGKCNGVEGDSDRKVKEDYSGGKVRKIPPEPPVRRLSKQEVLARLQKCQQLKNEVEVKNETKVHNSNLDEALNELEMIYNSLRLKDEDLVDRAKRRDLPVFRPKNPITSVSVRDKIHNFYAEADYPKTPDAVVTTTHQRAVPLRRSAVPDKTTDDMAFRRMHQKERNDVKQLPPQSYLRSSPALSPATTPTLRNHSPLQEPDVTFDDVVFRNIRHANSTLKIQDPQPPFGIPIGPIAPAPNSDYLHATPTDRFRPTFTSTKTPDVVKDDLAFRNLRKDNSRTTASLDPNTDLKKRAVRSLSANLYSIMHSNGPSFPTVETNDSSPSDRTQSLTDLSRGKLGLEKRLQELKEEKNAKRAEFFEPSKKGSGSSSWTELSESKPEDAGKKFRSPVVELSKYPAAAPTSSLQGNPFKEQSLDDDQLENLLSALAKEAETASKDLERQLDELETKKAEKIEEFNRKFKTPDKGKRRRNLSLSGSTESKEEVRKTGSLERRRRATELPPFEVRGREKKLSESDPSPRKRSQSFEMVTDLSQILHDVEVQQQLNNEVGQKETNSVFQEVYEYNCKLSTPERRKSAGEEPSEAPLSPPTADSPEDVETEFEKLHEEGARGELALVAELMADIGSVDTGPGNGWCAFPFPQDGAVGGECARRDGTSTRGEGSVGG